MYRMGILLQVIVIFHLFKFFSPAAEHLIAQHSAIKMLHSRVKLILDYIKAVENGKCLLDNCLVSEP